MKVSRLGLKTLKTRGSDEEVYQEMLFQSRQLKRNAQGIYSLGPVLTIARNNLVDHLRKKMNSYDANEVSLPIIQPRIIWDKSNRYEKYTQNKTMFTLEGRNGQYCLAPTGEEIMFEYVNEIIQSYKDMPITFYQIGNKYRDEIRARGGLQRSKEFLMKDAYSFHSNEEDMCREYSRMKKCYKEFFEEVGLKVICVAADSSEMGGKISNEFMVESASGEDTLFIDDERELGFNKEVFDSEELLNYYKALYPDVNFSTLRESKGIEVGHIFQLGQYYSKSMNGVYTDRNGQSQYYYMGCYGIGVNRTLSTIIEKNSDANGIGFSEAIRPFDIGIVNIDDEALNPLAQKLYDTLQKRGIRVLWHDTEASFGFKLKEMKLIGVKNNIIIGKNSLNAEKYELETDEGKFELDINELIERIQNS